MFQAPPPPQDYLNETTIGTFGIATVGIFAVGVAFRKVFKLNHPLVPFVTSVAISFGLAASKSSLNSFLGWLIAAINACMLFCASVGANETVTDFGKEKPAGGGEAQGKERVRSMPALKSYFER